MKKKILFALLMVAVLACLFVISAGAVSVDYDEKAVLKDGTALPIYDANKNPLIWYVKDANATGLDKYASVPNNRNEANASNDTYVTYDIFTGWDRQLSTINIHVYNGTSYDVYTEDSVAIVVLNLRTLTSFRYIHDGLKVSDMQYVYFNEELRDCCAYFSGSKEIRLIDMTVCTNMTGGLGGKRNFYNCTNLHTVRFAPNASYGLTCPDNLNYRFAGTAIVELVIPDNITTLGVDNFRNCTKLENIYLLGNTTSLGKRNFSGCTSLTNIYILGDNPTISADDFKYNFYECVDGNSTYDFRNTGKYFFFVTTDNDYLTQIKDALGGDSEGVSIISYADYKSNPSSYTEGRYIISGANICDVYYDEHDVPASDTNLCVGNCIRCGALAPTPNGVHVPNNNCIYEKGYINTGRLEITCKVEGCTYCQDGGELEALISFLGYSAPEKNANRISVSYTFNVNALNRYEELTNTTLSYGLVASFATEEEKLEPVILENGEVKENYGKTVVVALTEEYVGFDFILSGFNNGEVNYCDTEFVLCAYVVNGTDVDYICYDDNYSKVQSDYAYTITLNTAVDIS